jgi:hypothetical protein
MKKEKIMWRHRHSSQKCPFQAECFFLLSITASNVVMISVVRIRYAESSGITVISAAKGTSALIVTYPVKGSFENGADWDRSIVND